MYSQLSLFWTGQKSNHTLTRGINLHRLKAPRLREHVISSAPYNTEARHRARITLHVSPNRP